MESRYRFRLYLLTAIVLFGGGTLLSRLYDYQIVNTDYVIHKYIDAYEFLKANFTTAVLRGNLSYKTQQFVMDRASRHGLF